jgi:hypothetical protein
MRIHFELKYGSNDLASAKDVALQKAADFLGISLETVETRLDIELKISIPEKDSEFTDYKYQILAHGAVKNNSINPI